MISVIIPVYNVEKYLNRCIQSIVNQTVDEMEIILVDDGSTDLSGMICDDWKKKDNRVKVIHKKNGGLSDARNAGLEVATGEWVTFVDSDDYVSKRMLEVLLNSVHEKNSDISICDPTHVFNENEESLFVEECRNQVYLPLEAIKEMWYQKSFLVSAWGKLYKRDLFDNVRFTKDILYEDVDIMHEIFIKCKSITYTNAKLYAYVHRENSITTQKFSKKDTDILMICNKIMRFSENYSADVQKAALAYCVVGNMRIFLSAPRTKDNEEIINNTKECIKKNAKSVLKDSLVRKKTKLGLILFLFNEDLFIFVHSKINRWK